MPAIRRPLRERCNAPSPLSIVASAYSPPSPTKLLNDIPGYSTRKTRKGGAPAADVLGATPLRVKPGKVNKSEASEHEADESTIVEVIEAPRIEVTQPTSVCLSSGVEVEKYEAEDCVQDQENVDPFETTDEDFADESHYYYNYSSEVSDEEEGEDVNASSTPYSRPACDPTKPRFFSPEYESPDEESHANDLECLHELIPDLFLAFSSGDYTPPSLTSATRIRFTHIIKMVRPTSSESAGTFSVEYDVTTGTHILLLSLCRPKPAPGRKGRERGKARESMSRQHGIPLLTEHQLLIARDFLSIALPYYSEGLSSEIPSSPAVDSVTALITAPMENDDASGAVDVMAVASCYLAYCSGENIEKVLAYINEEEEVPEMWRYKVGVTSQGTELINAVALMA
ncbi:hypothetical protein AX16_004298 [Volvariella volvacea WC 439]|nr:hypothetical protein AX16_004298 [Volvariella volvacea WC 439]